MRRFRKFPEHSVFPDRKRKGDRKREIGGYKTGNQTRREVK